MTHTKSTGPTAWWKVVLRSRSYIDNIQIYNRDDCCGERIDGVTVYVDGELVGTVVREESAQLYSFGSLDRIGQEVMLRGSSKIVPDTPFVVSVAEVEVYGEAVFSKY